jgi:hypothetical protein
MLHILWLYRRLITVKHLVYMLYLLMAERQHVSLPKPGQKTITVSGKSLAELEHKYNIEKTKHPNLSFAAFVSESALMELERRRILREAQFIS